MNKLDKHIISSINRQESNEDVIFRNSGFYIKSKGILQNFAVFSEENNTLFIRIDTSSYSISKRIFKNFDKLDEKYTICLGTDRISNLMIHCGYSDYDLMDDLPSLFHLYTKGLMIIFDKKNIDFKKLIFNTVEYFDCFEMFEEILIDNSVNFWKKIRDRYGYSYNLWTNTNQLELNDLEDKELNESDWTYTVVERKRSSLIDQILCGGEEE